MTDPSTCNFLFTHTLILMQYCPLLAFLGNCTESPHFSPNIKAMVYISTNKTSLTPWDKKKKNKKKKLKSKKKKQRLRFLNFVKWLESIFYILICIITVQDRTLCSLLKWDSLTPHDNAFTVKCVFRLNNTKMILHLFAMLNTLKVVFCNEIYMIFNDDIFFIWNLGEYVYVRSSERFWLTQCL